MIHNLNEHDKIVNAILINKVILPNIFYAAFMGAG